MPEALKNNKEKAEAYLDGFNKGLNEARREARIAAEKALSMLNPETYAAMRDEIARGYECELRG